MSQRKVYTLFRSSRSLRSAAGACLQCAHVGAVAYGENLYADALEAVVTEAEFLCGGGAEVDEASGDVGSAVGDADHAAAAVLQVGNAGAAGQGEGAVRGVELAGVQFLADGADSPVRLVVGGDALRLVPQGLRYAHGHKAVAPQGVGVHFVPLVYREGLPAGGKEQPGEQQSHGGAAGQHGPILPKKGAARKLFYRHGAKLCACVHDSCLPRGQNTSMMGAYAYADEIFRWGTAPAERRSFVAGGFPGVGKHAWPYLGAGGGAQPGGGG